MLRPAPSAAASAPMRRPVARHLSSHVSCVRPRTNLSVSRLAPGMRAPLPVTRGLSGRAGVPRAHRSGSPIVPRQTGYPRVSFETFWSVLVPAGSWCHSTSPRRLLLLRDEQQRATGSTQRGRAANLPARRWGAPCVLVAWRECWKRHARLHVCGYDAWLVRGFGSDGVKSEKLLRRERRVRPCVSSLSCLSCLSCLSACLACLMTPPKHPKPPQ
jgi:hypothetical protein